MRPRTARRVLVTRAPSDARRLIQALAAAGFEPVLVPLVQRIWRIEALIDAAAEHPEVDVLVITSAAAADVLATAAPGAWRDARVAAVGPATERRLIELGYEVDVVPARSTGEALVRTLGDLRGQRVLYPRAELATPSTAEALRAAGAELIDVVAYANTAPPGHERRLRAALPVRATTLLSGSVARRVAEAIPQERRAELGHVVVIGPSTAAVAREVGLQISRVASPHTVQGVLLALQQAIGA